MKTVLEIVGALFLATFVIGALVALGVKVKQLPWHR